MEGRRKKKTKERVKGILKGKGLIKQRKRGREKRKEKNESLEQLDCEKRTGIKSRRKKSKRWLVRKRKMEQGD